VEASALRFRVTVQAKTSARDGASWSGGTAYWADMEPIGASALGALGMAGSQADFRFTFRSGVVPDAGDRIVHAGKNYLIESVQTQPRGRTIVLARHMP
jgi:hypothetical protein